MTMTIRLVLDVARRIWMVYALAAFYLSMQYFVMPDLGAQSLGTIVATSCAAVYFVGVASPFLALAAREVVQLPVTRRDLWLTRVILGTVLPTLMTTTLKLAALAFSRTYGATFALPDVLLSSVYDFVYVGAFLGLAAPMKFTPGRDEMPWQGHARVVGTMLFFGGGIGWIFLFRNTLPLSWNQLTPLSIGWLATAAALTLFAFVYHPKIVARPSRPVLLTAPAKKGRATLTDGLTGIRLWMWKEATAAFYLCIVGIVVLLAYWAYRGFQPEVGQLLAQLGLRIFDATELVGRPPVSLSMMLLVLSISTQELMHGIRSLRVLPISTRKLALLLSCTSIAWTTVVWIALLTLTLVTGHMPWSLRPDVFVLLVGAQALARSTTLALSIPFVFRIALVGLMSGPLGLVLSLYYVRPDTLTQLILGASGVVAFAAATALNVWSLSRKTSIYKPQNVMLVPGTPMQTQPPR
jgi:hypothetical protein